MNAYLNRFRPRFCLTVEEAAVRFGVPQQLLSQAIRHGSLRSKREAHVSWVSVTAVKAFLELEQRRVRVSLPWNTQVSDLETLPRAS
jgi:hypothetical protein